MKTAIKFKTLQILSLLSVALMLLIAQTPTTYAKAVTLTIGTINSEHSSVEVPLQTINSNGLGALQFQLQYDPAVVEPVTVESGNDLANGMVEFNIKTPGQLNIAMVSSTPIEGANELLRVIFKRVKTVEGQTNLILTDIRAWDYENNTEMLVTSETGLLMFTKKSGILPDNLIPELWKIPLMIAAGTTILLGLLLAVIKRKKRTQIATSNSTHDGSFCQNCGSPHDHEARFCPKCGQAIT